MVRKTKAPLKYGFLRRFLTMRNKEKSKLRFFGLRFRKPDIKNRRSASAFRNPAQMPEQPPAPVHMQFNFARYKDESSPQVGAKYLIGRRIAFLRKGSSPRSPAPRAVAFAWERGNRHKTNGTPRSARQTKPRTNRRDDCGKKDSFVPASLSCRVLPLVTSILSILSKLPRSFKLYRENRCSPRRRFATDPFAEIVFRNPGSGLPGSCRTAPPPRRSFAGSSCEVRICFSFQPGFGVDTGLVSGV